MIYTFRNRRTRTVRRRMDQAADRSGGEMEEEEGRGGGGGGAALCNGNHLIPLSATWAVHFRQPSRNTTPNLTLIIFLGDAKIRIQAAARVRAMSVVHKLANSRLFRGER